jgi:hypothetical protein
VLARIATASVLRLRQACLHTDRLPVVERLEPVPGDL